ncbi:MAG: hypothetical protein KatS3mg068_0658 [Candidatus Sericytochromatia bacterium]|nr:MAG: hypothetical protein KatS3mg068_0658 [Candidatus Sericytochromatia bacterium]
MNMKKVLIYEPFVLWYYHFVTSLEIALNHINNGDDVYFLACKSSLSTCQENCNHNLNLCLKCNSYLINGIRKINLPEDKIIYIELSKYKKDIEIPKFNNLDEFRNFEIDGIDFGQAAYSSLVNLIRDPFPNINEYYQLIERMLIDEIAIYKYAIDLLKNNKFEIVYLFNGRYSTQRPFLRACQKLGVKTFTHERGGLLEHYFLVEDTFIHDIEYLKKDYYKIWNNSSNYEEKFKIAKEYYSKRFKGWGGAFYSFTDKQKLGKLPENFDKNKINIVIFNSSEDEYVGFKEYENNLYKKEIEIFEKIFKFTKNKNIYYYLRVHPNLKGLNNSQIKSINELKYDNLTVIPPESDISTYGLMKACDKVIVTLSTTGIEANFLGKVVISLGVSWYDSLNIAYKPKSYEELMYLIEDENLKPLSNEGSIIYAYWLIKKGIPFKYYKPEAVNGGKFSGDYIDYNIDNKTLIDIVERIYYSNFEISINQEDLVSVIMPAYNSEKTLYESAMSVLNQSYKNLELIIINDGSKDNTEKIANELLKKDNRVVYIKQNNKGVASARNTGIKISKGKYIKFLDSDDILFRNSIELLFHEIKKNENCKIVFGNFIINNNGTIKLPDNNNRIQISKSEFFRNQLIGNLIATGTVLIEKSILNDIGLFDENLRGPEDYDLWNRIIQKYEYVHVNFPIYIYMIYSDEQLTKNVEKLRYYTDIAANKLLEKLDLKLLFSDITNNVSSIPTWSDNLVQEMLKRTDTCHDTILNLIDKTQELSYSKNRENKKLEVINDNNSKFFISLISIYQNLYSVDNIDIKLINNQNKLSLSKIFFVKNYSDIFREYYQNNYLNFLLETNHRIISCNWYLKTIPIDIINYINLNIDLVLVPNKFVFKNLVSLGILDYKVKILQEFLDYHTFNFIGLKKEEFNFIYTGKITFLSGIDKLIEAFKEEFQNDNVNLLIHSNGIYDIEYFKKLKEKLNDKIKIITDNYSEEELNEFINKSSCFVYPYRLEGSLVNILKAIACNIPVILTDKGISEELPDELFTKVCSEEIEDEEIILSGLNCTGTFAYYEVNKESLKLAMREVYSNYELYKEKAFKLREYVIKNYNVNSSLSKLNDFVNDIKKNLPIADNLEYFESLWYEIGNKFIEENDFCSAEKYFRTLVLYKEDKNYFYKLALCLYKQNQYEQAIDLFIKSLSLGLINRDILNYISDSLYQIGDIDTSNYYKNKALALK